MFSVLTVSTGIIFLSLFYLVLRGETGKARETRFPWGYYLISEAAGALQDPAAADDAALFIIENSRLSRGCRPYGLPEAYRDLVLAASS